MTQFPLYENIKERLRLRYPHNEERDQQGLWTYATLHSAIAGSLSGAVAAIVTQPVDVVRTRIMLEGKVSPRPVISLLLFHYTLIKLFSHMWHHSLSSLKQKHQSDPLQTLQSTSIFPRIATLYRDEGFSALFRGTLPRLWGAMAAGGLYLGLYEAAKGWVRYLGIDGGVSGQGQASQERQDAWTR